MAMLRPVREAISRRVTSAKGRLASRSRRAEARKAVADMAARETIAKTLISAKDGSEERQGLRMGYSSSRAILRTRPS